MESMLVFTRLESFVEMQMEWGQRPDSSGVQSLVNVVGKFSPLPRDSARISPKQTTLPWSHACWTGPFASSRWRPLMLIDHAIHSSVTVFLFHEPTQRLRRYRYLLVVSKRMRPLKRRRVKRHDSDFFLRQPELPLMIEKRSIVFAVSVLFLVFRAPSVCFLGWRRGRMLRNSGALSCSSRTL